MNEKGSRQDIAAKQTAPSVVIVGGGFAGLLLALKLSKQPLHERQQEIVLIEQNNTLGGRCFFSSPSPDHGIGFELFQTEDAQALLRHIEAQLNSEELIKFEENNPKTDLPAKQKRYLVRKHFTPEHMILAGPSELFTKKEAEVLKNLVFSERSFSSSERKPDLDIESTVSFDKSTAWTQLSAQQQEAFSPLLSALAGPFWQKAPYGKIFSLLGRFFAANGDPLPAEFLRAHRLEQTLEELLQKRGVKVKTCCQLIKINELKEQPQRFELMLSDKKNPSARTINCDNLVLALPLNQCRPLLPLHFFSSSQSRFISHVRPLSLVMCEIAGFHTVKAEHCPDSLQHGDRFVFPVERAQGFLGSLDNLVCFAPLPYEESLQAPAVRETIVRLRKALSRVLRADAAEELLKKGASMPRHTLKEHISLLSVAHTLPIFSQTKTETLETRMKISGLYCCGDSFAENEQEPWKGVVKSVKDVAQELLSPDRTKKTVK